MDSMRFASLASRSSIRVAVLVALLCLGPGRDGRSVSFQGLGYSEPTVEAEEAWVAEIKRLAVVAARFLEACTPGYYNNEGHFAEGRAAGLNGDAYAPGANAFNALIAKWREKGDMEGLEVA